ncbi:hypothetical protein FQZ97_1067560 [compost metagenome]
MDARVVHQNLDRTRLGQRFQRSGGGGTVGDVEGHGFGAAAPGLDLRHEGLRLLQAPVGVHDDMVAVGGQSLADRGADAAAAAGDQGTPAFA